MKLERIAVATDGSEGARDAYRVARALAQRAGARVLVMRAVTGSRVLAGDYREGLGEQRARLEDWVASVDPDVEADEVSVEFGHPGIEIPRFAETRDADLLVLGRSSRPGAARPRAGDTVDAVVRRSVVPCLLVPPGARTPYRLLAAVDGTPRGRLVRHGARALARLTGMSYRAVTVEPNGLVGTATGRQQSELGDALRVRHGAIYDEVLAEIRDTDADLLALGVCRGGAAGVPEPGSAGRRLVHGAPCAVLTIPL